MGMRGILTVMAAMLLAACSGGESVQKAEGEVAAFHRKMEVGAFDAIWEEATPEFRAATGKEDLGQLLKVVHEKLGKAKKSEQVGWKTNVTTEGSFVEVQMKTEFEKGTAEESFIFSNDDKGLHLQGYNIQSNALIAN